MSPVIDTVTEYQDKTLEQITKFQDDVLGAVKKAVGFVEERLPETLEVPENETLEQIPTIKEIVDASFAFNKKLLSNQEKFAKGIVRTIKPLTREGIKAKAAKAAKAQADA